MSQYDGFEEWFLAHRTALSRTAYFLTADHAAAEDLLQEALTKAAGHWRRVSGGDPNAYVRQIMLNQVRSTWRRRHGVREQSVATIDARSTSDVAGAVSTGADLAAALLRLPPRQRAVLYLRYYEDLTEVETARLLGCAVGTVKSQAHDALARLRNLAPALAPPAVRDEVHE